MRDYSSVNAWLEGDFVVLNPGDLPARLPTENGGMITACAHPKDSPTNIYLPQVIFIDSIWLDMSSSERFGMR